MPYKSEKQRRFLYAAAEGKVPEMDPKDAKTYIAHSGKSPKRKLTAKRKAR